MCGEEKILHQLLCDRRSAAQRTSSPLRLTSRGIQLFPIEAAVLVEAAVLGGDHGVRHVARQRVDVDPSRTVRIRPFHEWRLDSALDLHHGDERWKESQVNEPEEAGGVVQSNGQHQPARNTSERGKCAREKQAGHGAHNVAAPGWLDDTFRFHFVARNDFDFLSARG